MSWNTKTVKYLEEVGCLVEMVEHYNGFAGVRQDFLGFADAIALNPSDKKCKCRAIQITSSSNLSSHWHKVSDPFIADKKSGEKIYNKIRDNLKTWLKCGNGFLIIAWYSDKLKDKKCRIREVVLDKDGELTYSDVKGD